MDNQSDFPTPGPIALFGSGETSPSGQKIFDFLFKKLPANPQVSIVETPAGFELNSERIAGNVADFLQDHLRNYEPQIRLIPARKKGTDFSPDHPEIAELNKHVKQLDLGNDVKKRIDDYYKNNKDKILKIKETIYQNCQ